jgi:ABC-type glycerol-3-phosphate transport system substrate-binding protein
MPGRSRFRLPRLTSQWEKGMLNTVGNTNGGGWHCVISQRSKQKEAAYDFLAFMANKKNASSMTGVQPGMKYEYFAPVGTGRVMEWENQGWDKEDAIAYLNAYSPFAARNVLEVLQKTDDVAPTAIVQQPVAQMRGQGWAS